MSGAQKWKGTADTLNAKPTRTKRMPRLTTGFEPTEPLVADPMSVSRVEPVNPKMRLMP